MSQKVVIFEPRNCNRKWYQRNLLEYNLEVFWEPKASIEYLQGEKTIDVVVAELEKGGAIVGNDVLKAAHEANPESKRILTSSKETRSKADKVLVNLRNAGISVEYLQVPFDKDALLALFPS